MVDQKKIAEWQPVSNPNETFPFFAEVRKFPQVLEYEVLQRSSPASDVEITLGYGGWDSTSDQSTKVRRVYLVRDGGVEETSASRDEQLKGCSHMVVFKGFRSLRPLSGLVDEHDSYDYSGRFEVTVLLE